MGNTNKTSVSKNKNIQFTKVKDFFKNRQVQSVIGVFILLFGFSLAISFVSFYFTNQEDQSILNEFSNQKDVAQNIMGKIGANLSHFFIYKGFGVAAFFIPYFFIIFSLHLLFLTSLKKVFKIFNWGILGMIWIATSFGFLNDTYTNLAGIIGLELNEYFAIYLGNTGLAVVLFFGYLSYAIIRFKMNPDKLKNWYEEKSIKHEHSKNPQTSKVVETEEIDDLDTDYIKPELEIIKEKSSFEKVLEDQKPTIKNFSTIAKETKAAETLLEVDNDDDYVANDNEDFSIDIESTTNEDKVTENLADQLVEKFGEFDHTLELANFKFPTLNLLKDYNESIAIDAEELEQNKNKIVETLKNYKIGIAQIKATVGPTVTLYEIVPDAGVRISKIKNLEDDIALSLAALGIRIIAPIPGKGTIGIEVPNKHASIVSMRSVIASTKFQESKMELPIALGKTISNETFVIDLAKMPHLLMAGATGQGKSVGLNTILASLLYKKHPAEVKFILVDPKKVELTLFNKIERHYLAKLPDVDEAIITDTTKVIHTLNSLCIEMDNRYDLLKLAMVRNIKEYNAKFKARKLNPDNGHKFLPYIVLVIDEFADLIMTAGKEVETPIARLAQLARAIGIHLIVATQRPSVNVITGIIKANFPSRIAFRVTSKIDSRTILDTSGADQLIGKGDLLYSGGSDVIRIQCAFVDTPEIEKITDFIGSQRAYPDAYMLPEYIGEESGIGLDIDISDRDALFEEAANLIVIAQQGSASLLQRKLKLGYNRAGRLIDQLEAAGIVGPFEGSKARQVLVQDPASLAQLLNNEKK